MESWRRGWSLTVALGLCLIAAGARAQAADPFAQRMLPCAACHGEQGRASADGYYPRIAGKPAGYLFEQLMNFADGHRRHDQMRFLVERQRPEYLRAMADYFAGLDLPYPVPVPSRADRATLARGEALVRRGDPARQLPACSDCHGVALTGLQPNMPGLLGLPYDYLVAQIGAWREGIRHARAPDCMADIARALRSEDIESVAAWIAAQPVPTESRARQGAVQSRRVCGSLEPRP